MKNGFWKSIGKVPVLVLAVAVGPVALADGPTPESNPADGTAASVASPIPSTDPTASVSSPIRLISTDSILADPNCAPPAGPAAQICAQATAPCNIWSPCCLCNGCGGGATFQWAPDKWCNVGVGIRTSFNHEQGDNVNDKNFFALDEARLFFTGKVTQVIGFELNTDISGAGGRGFTDSASDTVNLQDSIHLLDAIVKFEFNDFVNFWMGRFLPPNDRSDLDGPFFINGWDYPFVSNYPGQFEGRDTGVAYWGQYGGGSLKWQIGLFNGQGRENGGNDWPVANAATSPNVSGNPELVARVVLNLLDPEPGYYNSSTYYGEKNIAAIGFSFTDQTDALEDINGHVGTFFAYNFDFLLENKMSEWGSGTFEAAYYHYDVGGDVANGIAGNAGFVFVGWMLPQQVGCGGVCGYIRPYARWQKYDYSDEQFAASAGEFKEGWDAGFQYVIKGHNARFDCFYGQREVEGGGNVDIFRTGMQLIF
jgi:hypothetical protein